MPSSFNTLMSSFHNSSLNSDFLSDLLTGLLTDFDSAAAKFDLDLTRINFNSSDLALDDDALESFLGTLPDISLVSDQAADLFTDLTTALAIKGASGSDSFTSIATNVFRAFQTAPSIFERSIFSRPVGLPDKAAAFATVASNGERVDNGEVDGRAFTASQLKWNSNGGSEATKVTFAFDNSFGVNGLSTERAKTLFVSALQTWAEYSPLNFIEVVDPGADTLVDIRAKSNAIDGLGNTLAFAYFPTVGDITYDTAEVWTENSFLETTVHELGHSLGLDHEDDTQAIMNSILGNRYTDRPFLFQDDINGIRSLYGSGQGSVTALNGTLVPPIRPNLVTNGSFEDVPVNVGEFATYRTVKGWSTISGTGLKVDRRGAIAGKAADGTAWIELDLNGQNSTIGQNIDTLTGQTYSLSVDYSNGGRPEDTTLIEVFWEGKKLDTLSGGGKGKWRNFSYEVKGGDRKVSTLAFRAMGAIDGVGGFIDNIVVNSARELLLSESSQGLDQGLGAAAPTAHRDPISGESSDPIAASLVASPFPSDSSLTHWV